jgi:hypothetical protein
MSDKKFEPKPDREFWDYETVPAEDDLHNAKLAATPAEQLLASQAQRIKFLNGAVLGLFILSAYMLVQSWSHDRQLATTGTAIKQVSVNVNTRLDQEHKQLTELQDFAFVTTDYLSDIGAQLDAIELERR